MQFLHGKSSGGIGWKSAILWAIIAASAFHLASKFSALRFVNVLLYFGLIQLARIGTKRKAFYTGVAVGWLIFVPQLGFFWTIFGRTAVILWTVLAFWIGLFVLLIHSARKEFGWGVALLLAPLFWLGLEYFRSELYYLRFSWVNAGICYSEVPWSPMIQQLGVYGVGFALAVIAAIGARMGLTFGVAILAILIPVLTLLDNQFTNHKPNNSNKKSVQAAGIQIEFPAELEVPELLDAALRKHPRTELFMLSEYAFDGPITKRVQQWCKKNGRYLIAGGKEMSGASNFYDTAFVIGPSGEVIFQQAKCVPIQFFQDGHPAREQKVWYSPWGKIGICICYDLSYARVTDELVKQGAQALFVPTMDIVEWGAHQHELHARVGPVRASEYGLPIFRLSSSGISQIINDRGIVEAFGGFPEQGKVISGEIVFSEKGKLPWDRHVAPLASAFTGICSVWMLLRSWFHQQGRNSDGKNQINTVDRANRPPLSALLFSKRRARRNT